MKPPLKTVEIELGGETRHLAFPKAALVELGIKSFTDGEGWMAAITKAVNSFEETDRLISIGLAHEGRGDTPEAVAKATSEWDTAYMTEVLERISQSLTKNGAAPPNGSGPESAVRPQ